MRITVLLGAGAAIDIGAPTTKDITQKVIRTVQGKYLNNKTQYTLRAIYRRLNNYYKDRDSNFEDIFHTLEMMYSYISAWREGTVSKFKPSLGAFVKPNSDFKKYAHNIHFAQVDLLRTVAQQISLYNEKYKTDKNKQHEWYYDFWNSRDLTWDVATLNYDTTLENTFDSFIDGFVPEKGYNYSRFYPGSLKRIENVPTITHLHGCINYGNPYDIGNKYIYEDKFHDVYKFDNYSIAAETWFCKTQDHTQSGEMNYIAPILTGLRKLEKLSAYPYTHYYYHFQESLIKNNCLLIVGYGFGDLYLNNLMERMNILHGKNKRVVIITCFTDDCYNPQIYKYISIEEYHFMCKQFKVPIMGQNGYIEKGKGFKSDDGTTLFYLDGFKNTVLSHKDEIITFFNS